MVRQKPIRSGPEYFLSKGANDRYGTCVRRLLAIPTRERLVRVLKYLLDEKEFLSPYGIRSLSQAYGQAPYHLAFDDSDHCISYEPAESRTGMFGGNSNWRGPIWFPVNDLLIRGAGAISTTIGGTICRWSFLRVREI